jgi:hypothetical protein
MESLTRCKIQKATHMSYNWSKSRIDPYNSECVVSVMHTIRPFSEDGGASAGVMESFTSDDYGVLHELLDSWIVARPGVGGKYLGYEAVMHESRVAIVSPTGTFYRFC